MRPLVRVSLLCGLWCAGGALAQPGASADSARVVPYRSGAESLAAVPGLALYLPLHVGFSAVGYTISAIWEERLLDRAKVWLSTSDGRMGLRPLANTDLGAGIHVFRDALVGRGDAGLTATWGRPADKRQHYLFTLSWPGVESVLLYYQEPTESVYGIGNSTPQAARARFLQEELRAQVGHHRRLRPRLDLGIILAYSRLDIHSGLPSPRIPAIRDRYGAAQLPGLDDRLHFLDLSASLRARLVDVPGSPTRGNLALVRLAYTQSVDDDAFSHLSVLVVSEQFLELFCRRIVSLRLGGQWRAAPGNSRIPFYQLASLGGNEWLRGYPRGRFRDRGTAFAATTYKFPVWKLMDGVVFYEAGRALSRPGDLGTGRWHRSWGGGVRVWVPKGVLFEQEFARSPEGTRFIFSLEALF